MQLNTKELPLVPLMSSLYHLPDGSLRMLKDSMIRTVFLREHFINTVQFYTDPGSYDVINLQKLDIQMSAAQIIAHEEFGIITTSFAVSMTFPPEAQMERNSFGLNITYAVSDYISIGYGVSSQYGKYQAIQSNDTNIKIITVQEYLDSYTKWKLENA